ncbi:MAG: M20 family metallopeptidase [Clostridia bacterium]
MGEASDLQLGGIVARDLAHEAENLLPELTRLRRQFHMNPELGMEEVETAASVSEYLRSLDLEVIEGVGGTGVIGLLRGTMDGSTVALRADMDALPMDEDTGVEYASRVSGKMHSCGHDAHTACLLGVAKVLTRLTDGGKNLAGNVKFLFQPAEEGPGGAEPMLADGAFEDPPVDAVFGLHVDVNCEVGTVGVRYGVITAAADEVKIEIVGSGGHGAHPDKSVDSVVVASHVVTALQTIVSREISPTESAVITIGKIEGGYRHNIIAPKVQMDATVRSLSPEIRDMLPGRIEGIIDGVTRAMRAEYTLEYDFGYPPLENDPAMVDVVARTARALLGADRVKTLDEPSLGAEDFAYFAQAAPGCFFRLGVRNEDKGLGVYPNHNPKFDLDEGSLAVGVKVMAGSALNYLASNRGR